MKKLNLAKVLPTAGIVGFSLCSTWALFNLFNTSATHPTPIYWAPSLLVELISAWAVYMAVDSLRKVTRSNQSKENRRFYTIIMVLFVMVAIPTLSVSVWANSIEFGDYILGSLFPIASLACAIGVALPDSIHRFEVSKQREKDDKKREKDKRNREKLAVAQRAEDEKSLRRDRESQLRTLGSTEKTYQALVQYPEYTQGQIAQHLGISRRSVVAHLGKLESVGLIQRNGKGLQVVG